MRFACESLHPVFAHVCEKHSSFGSNANKIVKVKSAQALSTGNMVVCGPIERLRLGGILCSCIESQDQFYYRVADLALRNVQVRWLRRLGQYNVQSSSVGTSTTKDAKPKTPSDVIKPPNAVINAQLDVVDSAQGPAIRLTSFQFIFADEDDGDVVAISESIVLTKTIPLRDIVSVTSGTFDEWARLGLLAGDGRIINTGVLIKSKSSSESGGKERVLIFEVKVRPGVKHGLSRDDVVKHVNTLVDFERSRLGLPELERAGEKVGGEKGGANDNSADEMREDHAIVPLDRTMSLNEEF